MTKLDFLIHRELEANKKSLIQEKMAHQIIAGAINKGRECQSSPKHIQSWTVKSEERYLKFALETNLQGQEEGE